MAECKFCEAMKVNRQVEEISRSCVTDSERKQFDVMLNPGKVQTAINIKGFRDIDKDWDDFKRR